MLLEKKFFYDWVGANETIFQAVNSLSGNPTYNSVMVYISRLSESKNFPYVFVAMAAFAVLEFIYRKITRRGGAVQALIIWIGVIGVFAVSFGVDVTLIKHLKDYFAYPRPYIVFGPQDIKMLGEMREGDSNHSFPSGHVAFATIVASSLWPMLVGNGPLLACLAIVAVAWSRIAMGMHFPADVLGGMLIGYLIVLVVRAVVYWLLRVLFKWKC